MGFSQGSAPSVPVFDADEDGVRGAISQARPPGLPRFRRESNGNKKGRR